MNDDKRLAILLALIAAGGAVAVAMVEHWVPIADWWQSRKGDPDEETSNKEGL